MASINHWFTNQNIGVEPTGKSEKNDKYLYLSTEKLLEIKVNTGKCKYLM